MKNKLKVWIARDENGSACIYEDKPLKDTIYGEWVSSSDGIFKKKFPSVKWEDDEPTEAYITLAEPQPKPKKAIDWEQRRYEIAKEMMYKIYRQEVTVSKQGQGIMLKDIADIAVAFADVLINKLKNESK